MKWSITTVAVLACTAMARPQGSTSNELIQGGCKKVTLVYARASTEVGNMGAANSVGPGLCKGLKKLFNNDVACQGVSSPAYTAGLGDNVTPAGTTQSAIAKATEHITNAANKCPGTTIVCGGFSQGTAVIFNAVSKLPENLKSRVVGVALYGYTHNKQNKGGIPNYPKENVKVFCPPSDGVCGGTLAVNAGHFSYLSGPSQQQGYTFLAEKIKAAQANGNRSPPSTGGSGEAPAPSVKGPKAKGGGFPKAAAPAAPAAPSEPSEGGEKRRSIASLI